MLFYLFMLLVFVTKQMEGTMGAFQRCWRHSAGLDAAIRNCNVLLPSSGEL